ncbi:MAG: RloB family protein [Candidatus Thermoplasmatota archaeon]|nr:RloB family protein [Candidatus Thermoplasmatota archaeon]
MNRHKRLKGIREPRRVIVVVCEGEKTEPDYFRGFRKRYSNVNIETVTSKYCDAAGIVYYAKKMKKEYELSLGDGDGIWCVFDADSNQDDALKKAVEEAVKHGIQVAFSNPKIELWFLLHYEDVLSAISGEDADRRLKKHIPNYSKVVSKEALDPKLSKAVTRAKALNKKHEKNGVPLISRESNPSSQVFRLIDFIEETKEANRRAASEDSV